MIRIPSGSVPRTDERPGGRTMIECAFILAMVAMVAGVA
jgi:hypothetical protein